MTTFLYFYYINSINNANYDDASACIVWTLIISNLYDRSQNTKYIKGCDLYNLRMDVYAIKLYF